MSAVFMAGLSAVFMAGLSAVFMAGFSAVFMAGFSAFYQPLDGLPASGWFTSLWMVYQPLVSWLVD